MKRPYKGWTRLERNECKVRERKGRFQRDVRKKRGEEEERERQGNKRGKGKRCRETVKGNT